MITDFNNFKLKDLYNEYNTKYFDSALPDIPVVYKRLKDVGGKALATRITVNTHMPDWYPGKYKIETIDGIYISNYRTYKGTELETILLHEMIHIYLYTKNIVNTNGLSKSHGDEFLEKVKDIEKKSGLTIPLSDDRVEIAEHIKSKNYDVVILKDEKKETYSIMVLPSGFFKSDFKALEEKMISLLKYYTDRTAYYKMTDDRYLLNYPVKRKLKKVTFYDIPIIEAERILKDGEDYL